MKRSIIKIQLLVFIVFILVINITTSDLMRKKNKRNNWNFNSIINKAKETATQVTQTVTSTVASVVNTLGNLPLNDVPKDVPSIIQNGIKLFSALGINEALKDPEWIKYTSFLNDYPDKKSKILNLDAINIFDVSAVTDPEKAMKTFNRFKLSSNAIESINKAGNKFQCAKNRLVDKEIDQILSENMGLTQINFSNDIPEANKASPQKSFLERRTVKSNTSKRKNENKLAKLGPPIDWKASGFVSTVEDQQNCGCCWNFAGISMIESFFAIKNKSPLQVLSRQQSLDCLQAAISKPGSCQGGHFVFMAMYAQTASFALASNYPYTGTQGSCSIPPGPTISKIVTSFSVNDKVTPQQLYNILKRHPVAVNIDAASQEFIYYQSGILKFACGSQPTHAVLVTGYGQDEKGTQYWIIKNSWGEGWGEGGFARIEIYDGFDGCFMYTNVPELS
jgi:KDEL-tailed cysteine endopeptidase